MEPTAPPPESWCQTWLSAPPGPPCCDESLHGREQGADDGDGQRPPSPQARRTRGPACCASSTASGPRTAAASTAAARVPDQARPRRDGERHVERLEGALVESPARHRERSRRARRPARRRSRCAARRRPARPRSRSARPACRRARRRAPGRARAAPACRSRRRAGRAAGSSRARARPGAASAA